MTKKREPKINWNGMINPPSGGGYTERGLRFHLKHASGAYTLQEIRLFTRLLNKILIYKILLRKLKCK